MTTFKNRYGTEYAIHLSPAVAGHVKQEMGIDLFQFTSLKNLPTDAISLCKLFWLVTLAEEPLETFTRSMHMQAIEDASAAFIDALCEFFPRRQADLLRHSQEECRKFMDTIYRNATESLKSAAVAS